MDESDECLLNKDYYGIHHIMIFIMSIYQVSLKQCRDLISFLQIHNQGFKFEVMFLERCTNAFSIGIYEDEDVYIIFM